MSRLPSRPPQNNFIFKPPANFGMVTQADRLFQQGLQLLSQGSTEQARDVFEKVIKTNSKHFDAFHLLGIIAAQFKDFVRADELFNKAIKLNPNNAIFYCNRGNVLKELKQLEKAIENFQKAVELKKDYALAYVNQSTVLFELKKYEESLNSCDKAIFIKPDYAEAYYNRGNVLDVLQRFDEALNCYDKAIMLKSDYAEAYSNRGNVLSELKHLQEALASYDKAIAIKPDYTEALFNRGNVLNELKIFDEALKSYDQAIRFKPDYAEAFSSRGLALNELDRSEEALSSFDQAIRLKSDYVEAFLDRGGVLHKLNRLEEAVISYDKAILLKPDYAEVYSNRGNVLKQCKLLKEALVSYDQAISLKPDFLEAYCNKALALLVAGEFKQGWALYDWRWKSEKLKLKSFKTDKTKALSLDAESYQNILVWGEQGIGDQILYAGMLDELFKAVPSAQVLLDKRLLPLFQRSMPHGIFKDINTPSEDVEFDAHLPIADLGSYFRVSPEDFAKTKTSYLIADAERAKNIRSELIGQKKYVCGISWSSHAQKKIGAAKSVQLTDLLPLLSNQDIAFVSLQYGEVSQELAAFNRQHDVTIQECASVDNFNDLDGHAALIEACDFVVTISNTSAHMAGALGKQTYLLFSMGQGALWYWSNQIDGQSMWYPNLCIYQQTIPGQWADCVDTVCKDIEKNI